MVTGFPGKRIAQGVVTAPFLNKRPALESEIALRLAFNFLASLAFVVIGKLQKDAPTPYLTTSTFQAIQVLL